jgi:hypothetical protein
MQLEKQPYTGKKRGKVSRVIEADIEIANERRQDKGWEKNTSREGVRGG